MVYEATNNVTGYFHLKSINNDLIDRLISTTPGRSYTFYDDDIFFKGGKADKLIAEIAANVEA